VLYPGRYLPLKKNKKSGWHRKEVRFYYQLQKAAPVMEVGYFSHHTGILTYEDLMYSYGYNDL
jgi:hypothetical protein